MREAEDLGAQALETAANRVAGDESSSQTKVDLSGLTWLERIPKIQNPTEVRALNISDTNIGDLAELAVFANLHTLIMKRTSSKDLAPIRRLHKLKTLDLSDSPISDLSFLEGLRSLRSLNLDRTFAYKLGPKPKKVIVV